MIVAVGSIGGVVVPAGADGPTTTVGMLASVRCDTPPASRSTWWIQETMAP
jgi:hypothetical protein